MSSKIKNLIHFSYQQIYMSFTLAKQNILRLKYRSILIIIGILLTIALETGIAISVDTLYDDFILDNRNQNYTDITVIPSKWNNLSELYSLANDIRSVSGVAMASPVYTLYSYQILGDQLPDSNVLVLGIDSKSHPDYNSLNITMGKRDLSSNSAIVSQRLLHYSGLDIGDTFVTPPELGFIPEQFVITGAIDDTSFFGNNIGYYFILVDIERLLEVVPDIQQSTLLNPKIDISCKNLLDIKKTGDNIEDKLGMNYFVWIEKRISDIRATGIHTYQTAMNLVIIVSFIVEFLFITNILAITIRDRSKEFGILRAIGKDSKQLIMTITIEILIYSIIGTILGIFIGIWFAYLLIGLMHNFYQTLHFQSFSLQPPSLAATFSSGILVALISGLYPLFLALSMPVVQNIHSRMRSGKSSGKFYYSYWKYTIIMGGLLTTTGFLLQLFVGPSRFLEFEILSIHFFVILFIFIGTLLVEIGILFFLPKIAFKLLFLLGTIPRTISMRNIAKEFQKSLFTVVTSALALTFIIIVGLVSVAVINAVPVYIQSQWGGIDLVAEGWDSQLPSIDLAEQFDQDQNISSSSFIQETRTEIENIHSFVYGVDPDRYALFAEEVIDSMTDDPSYYWLNQSTGDVTQGTFGLMSNLLSHKLLKSVGSNISIKIADNSTVNVTISAIIKSNAFLGNGEYLYISSNRFQDFFNISLAKWFVFDVKGTVDDVKRSIKQIFPQYKEIMEITFYAQAIENSLIFQSALFQLLFIESFILAGIAQFICILVSTYRMERDMGIMRSLGLHKGGVFGIFMTESLVLGLASLIIGFLDGLIGTILLARYISYSIPVAIEFPLYQILLWIFLSFLITLGSPILPAYRSSRKNIVAITSGRPMSRKTLDSSSSLWEYVKEHAYQIRIIFLVLMLFFAINYVLDEYLVIWGLIPFDFILRSLLILPEYGNFSGDYSNIILFINPLAYLLGIALVGFISYSLTKKFPPRNLLKTIVSSVAWGVIGNIICLIVLFIPIIIVLNVFNLSGTNITIFFVIFFIVIAGMELIVFHRVWGFLVFRGMNPHSTLKQALSWIRKDGSKGQFGFYFILIMHTVFQLILFIISPLITNIIEKPLSSEYPYIPFIQSELFQMHPILFLILSSVEVLFFLGLITFQVFQLKDHKSANTPI
ncbi:MAG: ABC transporter permease [Candidatus Hodarchaeota archaeon]